jgi:hypothetical protein
MKSNKMKTKDTTLHFNDRLRVDFNSSILSLSGMSTEGRKGNLFFSASSASSVYLKAILRFIEVKCSIFCFHFYCFSLPNFVGPLLWDKCTNGQIAFIPEKHISGTYFGEHFIDICDVADFGPFSHQS